MDPSVPNFDESIFNLNAYWKELYGVAVEEEPHRMPEPLGRRVYDGCFVDSNHGGNVITRHSYSVLLLFVKNALTKSFRKFQNTVQ